MRDQAYPRSRQHDIVMQNIGNEILIYNLKTHKALSLNETSALIWQECDGTKNIVQISRLVSEKSKKTFNEDLIWLAIDELKKENLIENGDELNSGFSGMSRREVIKKVGLGTMIALPIVSSIVAPTAAAAASLVLCNATCDTTTSQDASTCPNNQVCCGGTRSQVGTIITATGGNCQPFTSGCGLSC